MLFCLIYFFTPFSISYIPHNYVIPQAMPHAIPQIHSVTLPKTEGQINELCFITLWLRFDPSFKFQSYETETMNRNRMLLQTYHGHSASAASKKAFHGRRQYFSVSTLKFCVSFCVINFTFLRCYGVFRILVDA